MWRRGRRCRATASVYASRARGRRCSAAAPQRHVTCRVSASGLKKRRSVLKVGLFSFPVLFSLSFPLHLSLVNEEGQRTTLAKRSTLNAHPITCSLVLLGEKTSSYFLFTSPQSSPLAKTASRVFSGTRHTGPYPPESNPGITGGLHYKNYRILKRIGQA